jgi:hypothetical protein
LNRPFGPSLAPIASPAVMQRGTHLRLDVQPTELGPSSSGRADSARTEVMPLSATYLLAVAVAAVLALPAMAAEIRPDPNKTGGSVEYHTPVQVCGHSSEHRHFSNALRDEVLARYGLPPGPHSDYEIDHLVPVCLGGGNDVSNLWPQPRRSIEPKWNAEAKDRLETVLCNLVCDGLLDIGDAQEAITKDWIGAYHLYNE